MPTVRVVFCRNHHAMVPVIRAVTHSPWAHVALVVNDWTVIDATAAHGVAARSLSDLLATSSKYEIREIACPDPEAAYAFAQAQIGKPYDWFGALAVPLTRQWQEDDAWFCSELVEACLAAGGNQRFIHDVPRVSPHLSWMVA